jgi:hypothetical protein
VKTKWKSILPTLILLIAITPLGVMAQTPSITLNPDSCLIGNSVNVAGEDFTPNSTVTVQVATFLTLTATADIAGDFVLSFTMPPAQPFDYIVIAKDSTNVTATATLTVQAPVVVLTSEQLQVILDEILNQSEVNNQNTINALLPALITILGRLDQLNTTLLAFDAKLDDIMLTQDDNSTITRLTNLNTTLYTLLTEISTLQTSMNNVQDSFGTVQQEMLNITTLTNQTRTDITEIKANQDINLWVLGGGIAIGAILGAVVLVMFGKRFIGV